MPTVSTCLWFDDQAEAAVAFYPGLFPNSRILDTKYHLEGTPGQPHADDAQARHRPMQRAYGGA